MSSIVLCWLIEGREVYYFNGEKEYKVVDVTSSIVNSDRYVVYVRDGVRRQLEDNKISSTEVKDNKLIISF